MHLLPHTTVKKLAGSRADLPARPRWLQELFAGGRTRHFVGSAQSLSLTVIDAAGHRLVRARIREAAALGDAQFQHATIAAYGDIARRLHADPTRHPVRLWNYIPDIHRLCDDGLDRYMVFNVARYLACPIWLGTGDFQHHLPTASGVGHDGADLVIDALGMVVPGIPIENPRQTPAYQYSRDYGPLPPCFARAMMIPAAGGHPYRLLVGGTASIRGEVSVHEGDLAAQIDETLENLASLVRASAARHPDADGAPGLESFRELRVYHPRREDCRTIARVIRRRFPAVTRVEYMPATLCRKELLVEIEGVVIGDLKAQEP